MSVENLNSHSVWAKPLRVVLFIGCLPHLFYGFSAMFAQNMILTYGEVMSQATVTITGEMSYLFQIIGLFVFLNGAAMCWCLFRPQKSQSLLYFLAIILFCRGIQRLLLTDYLMTAFTVPPFTNVLHCLYAFLMGFLLLLCAKFHAPEVFGE